MPPPPSQVGALPDVYSELEINFFLLRRLLGVRSKEGEKQSKVRGGEQPWRHLGALCAPAQCLYPLAQGLLGGQCSAMRLRLCILSLIIRWMFNDAAARLYNMLPSTQLLL